MEDLQQKRFLWGLLLAWLPWLSTAIGLAYAFRGAFSERATGIAVVAGGLSEMFVLIGILSTVVSASAAIVLLSRTFSPNHWLRSLIAILSMGLSVLMILFVGLFCWTMLHRS